MDNQLLLWIIGRTKKRLIMGWIWRISDDQITLFDPSLIWLEHANRLEHEGFDLWHFEVHRRPAFTQEHLFVPHWPAQLQWTYPYPPLKDTSFDNARREMISMVFQPFKVLINPIILGVHFLRQTSHWEWTVAGDHVCRQGDENSQMNSRRSQPQPRPQWTSVLARSTSTRFICATDPTSVPPPSFFENASNKCLKLLAMCFPLSSGRWWRTSGWGHVVRLSTSRQTERKEKKSKAHYPYSGSKNIQVCIFGLKKVNYPYSDTIIHIRAYDPNSF